jgi:hypothetical protein
MPCGLYLTARADLTRRSGGGREEEDKIMQLQEIDTLQDLKLWVKENMQGATVEEGEGGIVIRTNLISTMGGYLHEREGE